MALNASRDPVMLSGVESSFTSTGGDSIFALLFRSVEEDGGVPGVDSSVMQARCMVAVSLAYWYGSQWSSGSTLTCGARGPGIESRCRQKVKVFYTKITAIRSFGHGLHIDCSA